MQIQLQYDEPSATITCGNRTRQYRSRSRQEFVSNDRVCTLIEERVQRVNGTLALRNHPALFRPAGAVQRERRRADADPDEEASGDRESARGPDREPLRAGCRVLRPGSPKPRPLRAFSSQPIPPPNQSLMRSSRFVVVRAFSSFSSKASPRSTPSSFIRFLARRPMFRLSL